MAAATDLQVQRYVNERVRPWSEQLRAAYLAAKDHKAAIDDVYAALTQQSPTWADDRVDGPPHLLSKEDVLAWNTFINRFIDFVEGGLTDANKNDAGAQYAKVLQACVQPVEA